MFASWRGGGCGLSCGVAGVSSFEACRVGLFGSCVPCLFHKNLCCLWVIVVVAQARYAFGLLAPPLLQFLGGVRPLC